MMESCQQLLVLMLPMLCVDLVYSQGCTAQQNKALMSQCINPYSSDKTPCSRRGDCACGVCKCHPRRPQSSETYSGQYCDCDDYSCSFHEGRMCGGKGSCRCGYCECNEGYTGKACECPSVNTTCIASNGKVCNGNGNCVCGTCKCSSWTSYKGPTCEECPTCPGLCYKYKECALCKGFQKGQYSSEECETKCPNTDTEDTIDLAYVEEDDYIHVCGFKDEDDDCKYIFTYEYQEYNEISLIVQRTKECPHDNSPSQHSRNIFTAVLSILSGTVLLQLTH